MLSPYYGFEWIEPVPAAAPVGVPGPWRDEYVFPPFEEPTDALAALGIALEWTVIQLVNPLCKLVYSVSQLQRLVEVRLCLRPGALEGQRQRIKDAAVEVYIKRSEETAENGRGFGPSGSLPYDDHFVDPSLPLGQQRDLARIGFASALDQAESLYGDAGEADPM